MSECSGARKPNKQCGASKRVSGASERANGRASGPVPQSWLIWPTVCCRNCERKVVERVVGLILVRRKRKSKFFFADSWKIHGAKSGAKEFMTLEQTNSQSRVELEKNGTM